MPESTPEPSSLSPATAWLGLVIGNTRLHWGWFRGRVLEAVWHTPHLTAEQAEWLKAQNFAPATWRSLAAQLSITGHIPTAIAAAPAESLALVCASVVSAQTARWQNYPGFRAVHLAEVPLANLYPTLGLDRALNLLGAGDRYGWPVLVIDAGTALTFTAGTAGAFRGGAILPGLTTQFAALTQTTASLPATPTGATLPPRWATNTPEAIRSGILYGALATIADFTQAWQRDYPAGKVVLTGGDGAQLYQWWQARAAIAPPVLAPNLTFWGLAQWRQPSATDR